MASKRKYEYYVTYSWSKGYSHGYGSIIMTLLKKIDHYEIIKEIREHIEKEQDLGQVVILDWKLMKS